MANSRAINSLLICPISDVLFSDPVLAEDGHTYERSAIENWIRQNKPSKFTGQRLSIQNLQSNELVKRIAQSSAMLTEIDRYEFTLNVDVKIVGTPRFQTATKTIYKGQWLLQHRNLPEIVLLRINGVRAMKEASFYVKFTQHPHIVQTFGFAHDTAARLDQNNTIFLIQEYAYHGSLYDMLQEKSELPKERVLVHIFLQIVEAMIYLAANNVIHGDLACRNVLVFNFDPESPEKNVVKITDFGLSRGGNLFSRVATNARTQSDIIPTRYAAPEVLLRSTDPTVYTEKSDVYSMGVLMWEAYTRSLLPWAELHDNEVIQRVTSGEILDQPATCTQSYWNIILKTWAKQPQDRPTFSELKSLLAEKYYGGSRDSDNNHPEWRKMAPGICLEGPCTNQSCKAFNRGYVIICLGTRKLDFLVDLDESTSKCPLCSRYVEAKDCGFIHCLWRWSGIYQESGKPPSRCGEGWKMTNDVYQKFNPSVTENVSWRQLIIDAKRL